jgi:hypothetical protein
LCTIDSAPVMESVVNSPLRGRTENQFAVLTEEEGDGGRPGAEAKGGKEDRPNDGRVSFDESADSPAANGNSSNGWKETIKKHKEKAKKTNAMTVEEAARRNQGKQRKIMAMAGKETPMDEVMKEAMRHVTVEDIERWSGEESGEERVVGRISGKIPSSPNSATRNGTTDRREKLREMNLLSEKNSIAGQNKVRWITTLRMEIRSGSEEQVETSNVVRKVKETWEAIWRVDSSVVFHSMVDDELSIRQMADFPEEKEDAENFFGLNKTVEESKLVTVSNKNGSKTSIGFKIESKKKIWEIKKDRFFLSWLRENKVFLFEHKCDTITVQPIGWFSSRATGQFDAGQAEIDLYEVLEEYAKRAEKEMWEGGSPEVPKFEMAITEVRHTYRNEDRATYKMECQAVEIRCEAKNKTKLKRMLQEAELPVREFGFFVPYGVPDSNEYRALINEQNAYLNEDFPIFIFGLHESMLNSKMLCPKTKEMVTMKQWLLAAEYKWMEGGEQRTRPAVNVINRARTSETIGKWAIRTTVAAADETQKLVRELIEKGNKTVEHAIAAKDFGGEFARGIRLSYHPDAAKYKERVKDRAEKGAQMPVVITGHRRDRNQRQYIAAWKAPTAGTTEPRSYSQAAQSTSTEIGARGGVWRQRANQGDDNTVSSLGGGEQSGSQEATIASMAASIEGLQASFQQQENRANEMETLIRKLADENKKLRESVRRAEEENKQAMEDMLEAQRRDAEETKTHNENMLAALFNMHKEDVRRIEERQLKAQSESESKQATTSSQVERILQMMLEDRGLMGESPVRKKRAQEEGKDRETKDDDTVSRNNTTAGTNVRVAGNGSPPRIIRQHGTEYHSIERCSDGEEIRYIETADGLVVPETLPPGNEPIDEFERMDTEGRRKVSLEPFSWADECESGDEEMLDTSHSRAAKNTREKPTQDNREAMWRDEVSGRPQDEW